MSIKIIIERKFTEDLSPKAFQAINEFRIKAMQQKGYVGGETLINLENNREVVVLSTWSSFDDWKAWLENRERQGLEKELDPYLEEPTKARSFMLGADAIKEAFKKFIRDSDSGS